jgi:hypothetical protein
MTGNFEAFFRVQIYCTLCGNRSMRRADTGQDLEVVLVLSRDDVERVKSEVVTARCAYCGSGMALEELGPHVGDGRPRNIRTVISTQRRLVVARALGTVTAGDVRAARNALRADPSFSPEFRELIDLTEATTLEMSRDTVASLASETVFLPGTKRAVVATNAEQFRIAQAFAAHAAEAGQSVTVFRNLEEAMAWLGDE